MLRVLSALAALLLLAAPATTFRPDEAVRVAPGEVPNEIVLGFHDGVPADAASWAAQWGGELVMQDTTLDWASFRFADAAVAERALAAAGARGDVRFAERDGYASIALVPNDPRYGDQWGFPAIFAEQAWDVELGSHAVKVAILDTGTRVTHPDLAANMCGPFVSTVPGSPNPDDDHGHGTHVAGTVAAVTNNGVGVAGTAQVCVMGARVLQFGGGQWTWIAAGVTWAADNGAHVISMSLQGPFAQVMEDAVNYAFHEKNVLVVSAAGNYGCPDGGAGGLRNTVLGSGSVAYPGAYDGSMAVAALAPSDGSGTAGFSSCGVDMEIAAPGESVLSTVPGPGYAYFSGTSMATPHVSGVAGLVKSQNPSISALALRCLLDLSADDMLDVNAEFPLPGRDYSTGWGKLNALKALQMDEGLRSSGQMATFEAACAAGINAIMY